MNKKKEQELVCLTEQCLKRYWEKDCEVMLSYCTDDILWTGAEQKEYIMGIEAVRKNFTELMNVIQPCIISNGEFIVVQNTGNACTVSGRYLVETLPEADYFLQAELRCTFVWERINDEPRIRHMHVSNPIGEMKIVEGSRFVNEMGRMAKKYMDEKIHTINRKKIVVEGINGKVFFINESQILYVEAKLRNCDIFMQNGEVIHGKMSFADFEKSLDEYFVKVHRSYIVNIQHVTVIRFCELVMSNGRVIPVPQKKYAKVREELMRRHI